MDGWIIKWLGYKDGLEEPYYIRKKVFVEEQKCSEENEIDELDKTCQHLLLKDNLGNPIGTSRVFGDKEGIGHIGRLAILKEYRGKGYGRLIMKSSIEKLKEENYKKIIIHAQSYAIPFYEKLGFKVSSQEFYEEGILHVEMIYS